MILTRHEAYMKLREWTSDDSLLKHALAVEATMKRAAVVYGNGGVDMERWGVAGLIHDADYERWPEEHPRHVVEWLQSIGEHELAHAVAGHYSKWNVPRITMMDKAIVACDELTGFVVACARIRPNGLDDLTPNKVLKKLKTPSFASKVDRAEVALGCSLLNVSIEEHTALVIQALRPLENMLGISKKSTDVFARIQPPC